MTQPTHGIWPIELLAEEFLVGSTRGEEILAAVSNTLIDGPEILVDVDRFGAILRGDLAPSYDEEEAALEATIRHRLDDEHGIDDDDIDFYIALLRFVGRTIVDAKKENTDRAQEI